MEHLPVDIQLDAYSIKQLKALILKAEEVLKFKERKISYDHSELSKYVDARQDFVDETLSEAIESELESLDLKNRKAKGPSTVWLTSSGMDYKSNGSNNTVSDFENFPGISNLMKKINESDLVDCNSQLDSCLISCLATSKKTIALHSDNGEDQICQNSPICVGTFGAERKVEFTDLSNKLVKTVDSKHRCLYVMKEGSQNLLKHRVPAGEHIINGNNIRYSLSFRRFLGNKTTHVGQSDRASSSTALTSSNSCRPRTVIFAGDSHFAKLDPHRLHKDKVKVFNISKGGSKLRDVEKALSDFYVNHSHEFHIEKIFLSIRTNDIRYCQDGVGFLTKPLTQLFTKTKELFPNSNIIVQNLLPLPITNRYDANNVLDFNHMLFKTCTRFRFLMINVFEKFLGKNGFRSKIFFAQNDRNVHLNSAGLGKLAKLYLTIIHSNYFNPLLII